MLQKTLHDQRKLELLRTACSMPSRNDEEIGNRNAMIREQFLGERFASRKNEPARITSCVRDAQQLEQAHHILIEEHVAVKLFEQIEHDVRLELLDCIANWKKLILHAKRARLVTELPETLHDVEFGFERERLLGGKSFE